MLDEVHADLIERKYDLNCAVVGCKKNVRLIYVTYRHDGLGNILPPDLRGPYLTYQYDYLKFMRGSRHRLYDHQGGLRARRYRFTYRTNEYANRRPDMPNFGFEVDQVFWMCQGHKRTWRRYHDQLVQIVLEAAANQRRLDEEFDRRF